MQDSDALGPLAGRQSKAFGDARQLGRSFLAPGQGRGCGGVSEALPRKRRRANSIPLKVRDGLNGLGITVTLGDENVLSGEA